MDFKALALLLDQSNDLGGEKDVSLEGFTEDRKKVYFEHIFPSLSWNDLLRFRRVCKVAKALADEYIKLKAGVEIGPEITIYEAGAKKEPTMASYLQLGFPTSKIYLMNCSGLKMFEKEKSDFQQFLQCFGGNVTELRVKCLSNVIRFMEYQFYEGLVNLKVLNADTYVGAPCPRGFIRRTVALEFAVPKTFQQLVKFTIGVRPGVEMCNLIYASRALMNFPTNLEYAGDAYGSFITDRIETIHTTLTDMFNFIRHSIESESSKLKFYDFAGFYEDKPSKDKRYMWTHTPAFLDLAMACVDKGVKLLNVNSYWLDQARNADLNNPIFVTPVVSMVNMHAIVPCFNMPNLEKVVIPATSTSSMLPLTFEKARPDWPKLKILEITVDSEFLDDMITQMHEETHTPVYLEPAPNNYLMEFFFVGVERPSLKEVTLKFVDGVPLEDAAEDVVSHLGNSCPNLTKLVLINWLGQGNQLQEALKKLTCLEELTLRKCVFVGDNTFEKDYLKSLRKLSLAKVDQMPRITDKLFMDVLRHLGLTHFTLSSGKALTKITPVGIRALLDGEFGKHIQHFPFQGWSMSKVAKQDLQALGKEFRSSHMI